MLEKCNYARSDQGLRFPIKHVNLESRHDHLGFSLYQPWVCSRSTAVRDMTFLNNKAHSTKQGKPVNMQFHFKKGA